MQESSFKIYNASAGSGKTYALSKAYLKIVLSVPFGFKKVLAITFTNKAVNEMKHRILDSLFEFSKIDSLEQAPPLFIEILKELKLTPSSLRKLSEQRLKEILHNYAFFDISTIDKFTHRLIRTFAKDLKIPQNFEVIMDTGLLLDEAVARIIAKAGQDTALTKVLIDFALEKIDDDRSWDIGYDLTKIGKLIFDENNITHLSHLSKKELDDFLRLQDVFISKIKVCEKNAIAISAETLSYIQTMGLEEEDFPRKTLPNHFKKVKESVFAPTQLYNNKLEENLIAGKIVKSGVTLPSSDISSRLLEKYLSLKEQIYKRSFLLHGYRNLVPLTLLNAIQKEIKLLQEEKDQLSISEFNSIISKEIKNQPAPFIYERLGEKYRHYFIDEFQDTSEMQWNNLIPLIANALESQDERGNTGTLFLVGDVKQAIYRWRGGKAEQFLRLAAQLDNPFSILGKTTVLPKNYRSHDEIVHFNNDLFQNVSPLLENRIYREFFQEGTQQETNQKDGGYVKLSFLEEDTDEEYASATLEAIHQSLSEGYGYGDICVIVRKKKHGVYLANYLMQQHIPVISSESLLLFNSPKIRFLVSLIRSVLQPSEAEISYEVLHFLSRTKADRHAYISNNLEDLQQVLKIEFNFNSDVFRKESVFDALENAIKAFDLSPKSDAHLMAFMDAVLEVEQKQGADMQSFLTYWDKKGDKLSISMPENVAAVQIMTIHKSKGLEFPVVIFPYANVNMYEEIDPKLWIPVNPDMFLGFKELLISKKQEVQEYGEVESALFTEEQHKLQLDAFNLLYVVLTRAISALFIISFRDLKKDGAYKTDYFSGLFIHHLHKRGVWNPEKSNYEFGKFPKYSIEDKTETSSQDIPYIYTYKDRPSFKVLTKAGMLWGTGQDTAIHKGNTIHYILSLISYEDDLESAFIKSLQKGIIETSEVDEIKSKVLQVIHHQQLKSLFDNTNIVFNERDILMADGTTQRPDRVVINNNNVTIIDYKTGERNTGYHRQIKSYANAYSDMGYVVSHKIIVYIDENITVEFI